MMTDSDHASPVYLILGATGGIGSTLARRLAARGARLALAATTPEKLESLKDELPTETFSDAFDATEPAAVEAFAKSAKDHFGRLDGLANLVGSIVLKPAHTTSDEEFDRTLRLNLWTSFGATRAAAKTMRSSGGSVVLMSTAAAEAGIANHEAIAAAKAGVTGLGRSAASTYATNSIRFNVVAPGLVNTPGAEGITKNEMALKASAAMHALGRIGEPEDVAPLIDLLLSDDARWITGQVFGADGGLATLRTRVKV
ncbi:MAG: SDR family oxidoreductase [Planctomycetota bacterium]